MLSQHICGITRSLRTFHDVLELHIIAQLNKRHPKIRVANALELRRLVTNRLIKESVHPDAKVRIRALELLGKISDVGLFTERSEVTINHRSTSDLESKLREKLQKLLDNDSKVDLGGDVIDVKEVLGVKDEENAVEMDERG